MAEDTVRRVHALLAALDGGTVSPRVVELLQPLVAGTQRACVCVRERESTRLCACVRVCEYAPVLCACVWLTAA
jgi:hypothetical protein